MIIGYLHVETSGNLYAYHVEMLKKVGCDSIYEDSSEDFLDRPRLHEAMEMLQEGDNFTILELNHISYQDGSTEEWVRDLHARGISLRIVSENVDTSNSIRKVVNSLPHRRGENR